MKSGPSRVNAPLEGLRFQGPEGTFSASGIMTIKADKWPAGGTLHAKEEVGRGGGAHREWCSVGKRGEGERLWVSAWCLGEVYKECELN